VIASVLSALQLWVALLSGLFTLWAAAVALAEQDDAGVPRLLTPSSGPAGGPLPPARSLHVLHMALLAIAAALAGTALAWWAWEPSEALFRYLLAVLLVWILGEVAPRLWAANEPGSVSFDGPFVQHTLALFRPLLAVVAWVDRGFRPRRILPRDSQIAERQMLTGVLALAEMSVSDVMTPRLDIISVDFSATRDKVIDTFRQAEHSRLLVVDGDPDSITGVIYAKDLLPGLGPEAGPADWHPLIRPVDCVPEAKSLDRQLRDFQRSASHLVVVVDEFGGTSGIVTLEDVLEQIVGEIRDEYDTDEVAPVQRLPEGGWAVQGGVSLVDLESELGHSFAREDVSTVGGLVLAVLGRVPRAGEMVALDGYQLTVDHVARRRIRRVTVMPAVPAASVPPAPEPGP
jgi:CBS domain containing-hemolysin-like protein